MAMEAHQYTPSHAAYVSGPSGGYARGAPKMHGTCGRGGAAGGASPQLSAVAALLAAAAAAAANTY